MVPCGPAVKSITGVEVTPISGVTWLQPRLSEGFSPDLSVVTIQSCVPLSASNA